MPLFEFTCTTCNQPFEELLRSASATSEVTCPACGSPDVKKRLSTFASRGSGGSSFSLGSNSSSSCGPVGT